MAESIPHSPPATGETEKRQKSPAVALFDTAKSKLDDARYVNRLQKDNDNRDYVDLKRPPYSEYDLLPTTDLVRITDRPLYGSGSQKIITIFHLGDEKPLRKVSELELDEEQRAKMDRQGVTAGEDGEVYEAWKRIEVEIDNPSWIKVREVTELMPKDMSVMPEGHEGPWGRVQVSRDLNPASPGLASIADAVDTTRLPTTFEDSPPQPRPKV